MTQDEKFMLEAIDEAKKALALGEVPVGAVIVRNGTIIGRGYNRRETDKNAAGHAEMAAVEEACKNTGGWRLWNCCLYVTLEPCPMCAGAVINSRIDRVVFGAYDKKAGSCSSVIDLFALPFNHRPASTGGVLGEECAKLLSDFFVSKRTKNITPPKSRVILTLDTITKSPEEPSEALRLLKKDFVLVLLSFLSEDETADILHTLGLEAIFDSRIFCSRDLSSETAALRHAVRRHGTKSTVLTGSTDLDRAAAQTSGIEYLHAAYSGSKTKAPCRKINSLSDITELKEISR